MDYVPMEEDVLPIPYEVDWELLANVSDEEPFLEASFYLLRECGQVTTAIAGLMPTNPSDRNNAVLMGMVVKISKLLRTVTRDLSNNDTFQRLSMARQVVETAANLQYLMLDDGSGMRYDKYVQDGLVAERIMLLEIDANVTARGGTVLDIERRMRESIRSTVEAGGFTDLSTLPSRTVIGLPNIETRVKALGSNAYFAYRSLSAEVHGTWSELFKYHLTYDGTSFAPNLDNPPVQAQIPTSLVSIVCAVLPNYLRSTASDTALTSLEPLLHDLDARKTRLTELHEAYLENSPS